MVERQKLEKKLDTIVREIISLRDKECITCGSKNSLTAGYFMKRRHLATRWDLHNVNGQCWECNGKDNWNEYYNAMITRYGYSVTERMIRSARSDVKLSNGDLKELYEELVIIKNELK